MLNNSIENLEVKLQNAKIENEKAFNEVEATYNEHYRVFIDGFFKTDVLGAKKTICALFELEQFNKITTNNEGGITDNKAEMKKSLETALEKGLKILPISQKKKEKLHGKILSLDPKKHGYKDIYGENTQLSRDSNFPVLENLLSQKMLNQNDMLSIYSLYKTSKDLRSSLSGITQDKKELVESQFYALNNDKKEERINDFSKDFGSEIEGVKSQYSGNIVNGVVQFVGRNYFKLKKIPNKVESKQMRLKRTFKIALLKLLRHKFGNVKTSQLLEKIDSVSDFESLFSLIEKLIDIIPENDELLEKCTIGEELDEIDSIVVTAEDTKEKILKGEQATVKVCTLIAELDEGFDKKSLDKLLGDDCDLVGKDFVIRERKESTIDKGAGINGVNLLDGGDVEEINAGILANITDQNSCNPIGTQKEEDDEDEEITDKYGEEYLEEKYKGLKTDFNFLDMKKQKLFAEGKYEDVDKVNEELLSVMMKLEKINTIVGNDEDTTFV